MGHKHFWKINLNLLEMLEIGADKYSPKCIRQEAGRASEIF
jgi:hypothetical protein